MQVPPPMPQPLPEIPHENPEHANPSPEGQGPTGGPGYGTKYVTVSRLYCLKSYIRQIYEEQILFRL